jgi:hypothetical protein
MQITIRHESPALDRHLKALAKARGESVNATVLAILTQAVGVNERRERLRQYATLDENEAQEQFRGLSELRQVDDDVWR